MKKIVTHSGNAHNDDFVAVCIALAVYREIISISRVHKPDTKDLTDPSCLIIDVGMDYDPAYNNFDHHQRSDDRVKEECALSLFCNAMEIDLSVFPWYRHLVTLDSQGPVAAARSIGLGKLPPELIDPIGSTMLSLFSEATEIKIGDPLFVIMKTMGETIISKATVLREAIEKIDQIHCMDMINGVPVVHLPTHDTNGFHSWRERQALTIGICVSIAQDRDTKQPKEGCYSLYRVDDHPAVDFRRLDGRPEMEFIHQNGFLASTKEISREMLDELLGLSVKVDREIAP